MPIHSKRLGDRLFDIGNVVFLALLSLVFIVPFLSVLSTSLISTEEALRRGAFILVPEKLAFDAYALLLGRADIVVNGYKVTLFRVVAGTALSLVFTAALAYGLAKRKLPGRNGLVLFVFITMIFHGGLIPQYMLITKLGLKDSLWVLVLPSLVSAWNLFIMRNYFLSLPEEIEESAVIDGASPPMILWKIVIPVSMPVFATIGLFYAVHYWNEWFQATIYINSQDKMPIQVVMRNILVSGMVSEDNLNMDMLQQPPPPSTVKSAMIIISTLPILFVYPFIQKYFVKGAMVGSIKG